MASETKAPTGPDFEHGVAWEELADGEPLLGQVGGDAVLLVRRGEEAFAVGAKCTHYGGPLAEGLVVGHTVRCPLHHACFDLRTGEAAGAPALDPIPCWEVHRRNGRVTVGARRDAPPGRKPAKAPSAVVIVGAGAAGAACAEALRREGYDGPVTLVGDELPGPVDRPNLSKDYLAGEAKPEWIPLRGEGFYADQEIDFVLGDAAVAIAPMAHTLTLESGRRLDYGAAVLATGAEPRRLTIPGADGPQVRLLRTLADSQAIVERAAEARRATVIGASFIGLEVAASLRHRGLEVAVVAPEQVPLARVFGDEIGSAVRRLHEENGVHFHLGRSARRITLDEVELDDGTRLATDLVVAGVGVTPRVALAEAAGLRVEGGIVVDDHLRTSAPDVYAAGDVTRYPDPWTGEPVHVEHFVAAQRQGQAAARALLGGGPYRDVPFFWSQHYDLALRYVGHASSWDRIETRGRLDDGDFAAFFLREGRMLAAVTVGRDRLSLRVEAALEAGDGRELETLLAAA